MSKNTKKENNDILDFLNINNNEQNKANIKKQKKNTDNYESNYELKINEEINSMFKRKSKVKTLSKKINFKMLRLFSLICIAIIIGFIYFSKVNYYYSHFEKGTKVNNLDLGLKTKQEAEDIVKNSFTDQSLEMKLPDGTTRHMGYFKAGGQINPTEYIDKLLKEQNPWFWFLPSGKSKEYKGLFEFDYDYTKEQIKPVILMHLPIIDYDHAIVFDQLENKFMVNKNMKNKSFPGDILIESVYNKLTNNEKFVDLTIAGNNSIILKNMINKANKIVSGNVSLRFGDKKYFFLKKQLSKFVKFKDKKTIFLKSKFKSFLISLLDEYNFDSNGKKIYYKYDNLDEIINNILKGNKVTLNVLKFEENKNTSNNSKQGTKSQPKVVRTPKPQQKTQPKSEPKQTYYYYSPPKNNGKHNNHSGKNYYPSYQSPTQEQRPYNPPTYTPPTYNPPKIQEPPAYNPPIYAIPELPYYYY